ncbi:MAG: hypothetical protein Q7U64_06065 [Desulfocapsaceae bacterium]|nr:hypothetical protein [Desulfocapsaceae bacterium]
MTPFSDKLRFIGIYLKDNPAINDQRLKQVRFAGTVFADKDINKTVAVKGQGKIPEFFVLTFEALAKVIFMVRQAHHERKKVNNSSMTSIRPELAEGYLRSFARGLFF